MDEAYNLKYCFTAVWPDPVSGTKINFYLNYFPYDNTVELIEMGKEKVFLKRTREEHIHKSDFYVGSQVSIFRRTMTIVDYADLRTKNFLCASTERTIAIIKPDAYPRLGDIITRINNSGFTILNMRMVKVSKDQAEYYYRDIQKSANYSTLALLLSSGPVVVIMLSGMDAICSFRQLTGPTDPNEARKVSPCSLRARFGRDKDSNAVDSSKSPEEFELEREMFFPTKIDDIKAIASALTSNNSTLCLIKPHAVRAKLAGPIIKKIQECDFQITAIRQFYVSAANAAEFYEIYDGVVPEYKEMVLQLTSGACIALEITTVDFNPETPSMFRKLVGPASPDMARQLRPGTLRALFGTNKVENAIHCTDLQEDGVMEVEYFFQILMYTN